MGAPLPITLADKTTNPFGVESYRPIEDYLIWVALSAIAIALIAAVVRRRRASSHDTTWIERLGRMGLFVTVIYGVWVARRTFRVIVDVGGEPNPADLAHAAGPLADVMIGSLLLYGTARVCTWIAQHHALTSASAAVPAPPQGGPRG